MILPQFSKWLVLLWGVFPPSYVCPLHQHLNTVHSIIAIVLSSGVEEHLLLVVFLLVFEMQFDYLQPTPHDPQYLHQDQTKLMGKHYPSQPPWEHHFIHLYTFPNDSQYTYYHLWMQHFSHGKTHLNVLFPKNYLLVFPISLVNTALNVVPQCMLHKSTKM